MRKIFWVTPNLANGGAERVTAVLADAFAEVGWESSLVFMKDAETAYPVKSAVACHYFYGSGSALRRIPQKILRLHRLMKQNPDAVFAAMLSYESLYAGIAALGTKARLVCSLRNDPSNMKGKADGAVWRFVYPRAERIVFQTPDARDFFSQSIREKGCVIPNPLGSGLPEPYTGERKKEFVAVGRLSAQKNYPLLLRAFARVHETHPDWSLRVFGKGELLEELTRLCEQLGLSNHVRFCGFSEQVVTEIAQSGVYVLSSDYEGIPNALLEALAIGLPCVCTDCPAGGVRMFVKPGANGALVPVGDEAALAAQMLRMIEDPLPPETLRKNALALREALSPQVIAEKWMEIL